MTAIGSAAPRYCKYCHVWLSNNYGQPLHGEASACSACAARATGTPPTLNSEAFAAFNRFDRFMRLHSEDLKHEYGCSWKTARFGYALESSLLRHGETLALKEITDQAIAEGYASEVRFHSVSCTTCSAVLIRPSVMVRTTKDGKPLSREFGL